MFWIADVARDQFAAAAFFFHLPLRFLCVLVFVEISDGHICAFFGKSDCDRPANAGIASGDDGHFVLEFSAAALRGRFGLRARFHFVFASRLFAAAPASAATVSFSHAVASALLVFERNVCGTIAQDGAASILLAFFCKVSAPARRRRHVAIPSGDSGT